MKGTSFKVLTVLLACCVLIAVGTTSPSSSFTEQDKADLKRALSSSKSFLGNKNTYYTVASLKKLGAEVPDKNKHCDAAKSVLSKEIEGRDRAETIFYAVGIAETLGCGQSVGQNVVQELKKALASQSLNDLYFGLSSVLLLRANKHIDGITDNELSTAVNSLVGLQEDDGTFKSTPTADESTVYNAALALKVLAQAATELKTDKSKLEPVMNNLQNAFTELAEQVDNTLQFSDIDAKHSNLKITGTFLKGFTGLASALNYQKASVKKDHLVSVAEYLISNKAVAAPEEALSLLEGLEALSSNNIGIPVVVTIPSASASASGKVEPSVHVTNVMGAPVNAKVVLTRAYAGKDKSILSNQELAGSQGVYTLNLLSAKPEPGFYNIELKATPSDKGHITVDSVTRAFKVASTISISDVQINVAESEDPLDLQKGRKYNADYPKSVSEAIVLAHPQHLYVNFKVTSPTGKLVQVDQAYLRISGPKSEAVVVAKFTGKQYSAHINLADIAEPLSGNGKYDLHLIVGDAFVENSVYWKVGQVDLTFAPGSAGSASEDSFSVKPEIHHIFAEPAHRPNPSVSFAFSIATLAPLGLLFIGLLAAGANMSNYPTSGLTPIYALGFQITFGAILALYAFYWLALNMMQTLFYLGVLAIPFIFFATKTLNNMSIVTTVPTKAHTD